MNRANAEAVSEKSTDIKQNMNHIEIELANVLESANTEERRQNTRYQPEGMKATASHPGGDCLIEVIDISCEGLKGRTSDTRLKGGANVSVSIPGLSPIQGTVDDNRSGIIRILFPTDASVQSMIDRELGKAVAEAA